MSDGIINTSENENAYTIHAEVPGVKKDEINISIEGDQVAITLPKKAATSAKRITIQ